MQWKRQVYYCLNFIQSLLAPATCLLCGAPGEEPFDLCPGCRADLPWNHCHCQRCAAPLPQPGVCGACLRRPPHFDLATAPLLYRPPIDHLLQGFKFHQRLTPGRLLGELLAEHLASREAALPELIIPVPLHPTRQRQRGYNQALELARPLARRLAISLAPEQCRRRRATETQSLLPAMARRKNVRGAFELARPLEARHVAIVDDVIATGSTVGELARVLRSGGAETIEVWALARAGSS